MFNLVEGFWWLGLGIGLLFIPTVSKYHKAALATILILFGMSDFVEMSTGAWWRPWWLLAWKGFCVAAGLICILLIFKERRS